MVGDEQQNKSEVTSLVSSDTATDLTTIDTANLNTEAKQIIAQIIKENNVEKTKDLTQLFNNNQNKKTLVRINKMNDLLDALTDQALARLTSRPNEISNKELLDGMKIVQDMIERGQKQTSSTEEDTTPIIQINQQNNEVHLDGYTGNKESRERVKNAVQAILQNVMQSTPATNTIDAEVLDPVDQVELKDNDDED